MNTQYFRYALEVERTGSITQAASNLFMSQPTLSKAIKDMEETVGFSIFKRTSKGVVPTHRGLEFLAHARKIAVQVQKMEQALHREDTSHHLFSLAIPRVSYIAQAVSEYISTFGGGTDMEFDIMETNSMNVIDAVADGVFVLGMIRCHEEDREYFLKYLKEKDLQYESVWRSDYVALMRKDHPLAPRSALTAEVFLPYVEVAFGDETVPYIRTSEAEAVSGSLKNKKRVLVYDRATQLDILRANPLAYMWVSPLSENVLQSNNLIQLKCTAAGKFEDFLIYHSGYRFSRQDRAFVDNLYIRRNEVAYPE
ncbi:MAG: LysR family transcriptional regulator [Oscillospiraceae bacterium]|nr:LysR family transcriptional regulator [Oscillospiraceae bacterium]